MPFDNYNNVQQTTPNSCGAFALAAALSNFNLAQQTRQANLLNTGDLLTGYNQPGPQVTNAGGAAAFAGSIYPVTGNLELGADFAAYEYENPVSGMNPPSALVYIATLFGYTPAQIAVRYTNAGMIIFEALEVTNTGSDGSLLNTEINLLAGISAGGGMVIAGPVVYAGLPAENQVQIVLVQDGQHWIAINHLQLYDPGTGYAGPYELNDNGGQLSFDYVQGNITYENEFSGIWIQLTVQL